MLRVLACAALVFLVTYIVVGCYSIYWDVRHSIEIAPAPVMGEAGVRAQLRVRF